MWLCSFLIYGLLAWLHQRPMISKTITPETACWCNRVPKQDDKISSCLETRSWIQYLFILFSIWEWFVSNCWCCWYPSILVPTPCACDKWVESILRKDYAIQSDDMMNCMSQVRCSRATFQVKNTISAYHRQPPYFWKTHHKLSFLRNRQMNLKCLLWWFGIHGGAPLQHC